MKSSQLKLAIFLTIICVSIAPKFNMISKALILAGSPEYAKCLLLVHDVAEWKDIKVAREQYQMFNKIALSNELKEKIHKKLESEADYCSTYGTYPEKLGELLPILDIARVFNFVNVNKSENDENLLYTLIKLYDARKLLAKKYDF